MMRYMASGTEILPAIGVHYEPFCSPGFDRGMGVVLVETSCFGEEQFRFDFYTI